MSKKKGRDGLTIKVKTAKGRKSSSTKWLKRQLNDPYVEKAQKEGYRSRAAYKLMETDKKFNLLKRDLNVADLGSSPGSWSQVAVEKGCKVLAVDLQDMEKIEGVMFIKGDFLEEATISQIKTIIDDGKFDLIMSDMAAASCGHHQTDNIRIAALLEVALEFADQNLKEGGNFLAKVLQGGAEGNLLADMKKRFKTVKHVKPKASRADSSEMYVLAMGYRG